MDKASILQELWDLVCEIPPGSVRSYGELGKGLSQPATGRMVGRWMTQCPSDIPWWRVVAANGSVPIVKRSPYLADDQITRLSEEGVEVHNFRVDMGRYGT